MRLEDDRLSSWGLGNFSALPRLVNVEQPPAFGFEAGGCYHPFQLPASEFRMRKASQKPMFGKESTYDKGIEQLTYDKGCSFRLLATFSCKDPWICEGMCRYPAALGGAHRTNAIGTSLSQGEKRVELQCHQLEILNVSMEFWAQNFQVAKVFPKKSDDANRFQLFRPWSEEKGLVKNWQNLSGLEPSKVDSSERFHRFHTDISHVKPKLCDFDPICNTPFKLEIPLKKNSKKKAKPCEIWKSNQVRSSGGTSQSAKLRRVPGGGGGPLPGPSSVGGVMGK